MAEDFRKKTACLFGRPQDVVDKALSHTDFPSGNRKKIIV